MLANLRSYSAHLSRSKRLQAISATWVFLVIAAFVTVMAVRGISCDKPLVVWLSLYCADLVFGLFVNFMLSRTIDFESGYITAWGYFFYGLSILEGMFGLAWLIVGSVWVFKADDCSNGIWGLTLTLIIISYVAIVLGILIALLLLLPATTLLRIMRYAGPPGATPATDVTPTQAQLAHLPEIIQTEPNQECPICLSELEPASPVTHMPCSVKHVFHPRCIRDWLLVDSKCPICRKALAKAEEEANRP